MKKILAVLAGGLLIGAAATAYPELPPPTAEEKAAKAEKDAAEKAQAAKQLAAAQDRAVANYKKNQNKSGASGGATAPPKPQPDATGAAASQPGANHSDAIAPASDLTRKEAQTEMPTPAQANDHSSTARETVPSGR